MQSPTDLSHLLHALAAVLQEHCYYAELGGGVEGEHV